MSRPLRRNKKRPQSSQETPNLGPTRSKRSTKTTRWPLEEEDEEEEAGMKEDLDECAEWSPALSAYELERLENIRQNQAFLSSLNVPQVGAAVKPKHKAPQRGLKKQKVTTELLPQRKSLRLQKKEAEMTVMTSTKETEKDVVLSLEGPVPMNPVNMEESGQPLPAGLLSLLEENSVKRDEQKLDLKSYQLVLQTMVLDENRVTKVVKNRVYCGTFHPCTSSLLMAAGDTWGQIGLWTLGGGWGDDGVLLFEPHTRAVSCMAFSHSRPSTLISTSYDGVARGTDVERGVFQEVYRSDSLLKSFDFLSHDCATLLMGGGNGKVSIVDLRTPGTSHELLHTLNTRTLRSVHVHPVQKQYFITAESSAVHVYDVRKVKAGQPACALHGHTLSISSAYFSPNTGNRVLTTCMDNKLRVYDSTSLVTSAPLLSSVSQSMQTGRWLSKLRALWHPKQDDCFVVGSVERPRKVLVYHESGQLVHAFQDDHMTTVCSVTAFHPTRNALMGGNSTGKLHVFTDQQ
ncbi:WD repeat-containing protein 76-like isoform X2 [Denticeps clupeoides]|uniref:WD repeat-containing protein 76 n=1 Tax=Denticeps clupeoides TaxID=299321 RepID=A0AAY4BZT6_9TELE|nr:WD repeat-containing protein 76-like isoform X2 [Denticeps clupeoides]